MYFKQFFDEKLAQYAYLIGCQAQGTALLIDPMRDIDQYIDHAQKQNLRIIAAADTHIHADFISGLREFAERGVKVYASDEGGKDWEYEWLKNSGYEFDLMKNGHEFKIGNITIRAWHTPGHTPEHMSYYITDEATANEPIGIATGDFMFVGDVGRPDLLESAAGQKNVMEPSARTLYKSIETFKKVPEYLQVWPGHGAGSACGKALGAVPDSTVGYELRFNPSIKSATSEDHFVQYILEGQPEPPLYFARMKRENKKGPKVTGGVPIPKHLSLDELRDLAGEPAYTFLDTRSLDEFAKAHIPGSLLSTLNKQFNTVAGSYITDNEHIVLLVDDERVNEAARDLYRIGLDHLHGYVTPQDFQTYQSNGGKIEKLKQQAFSVVENMEPNSVVVDVRKASEFKEGHVADALNIAHTRLLDRKEELPADKTLLVHCQMGGRAGVASALLQKEGYDVVLIQDQFDNYRDPVTS